jgi:hypothetical protein
MNLDLRGPHTELDPVRRGSTETVLQSERAKTTTTVTTDHSSQTDQSVITKHSDENEYVLTQQVAGKKAVYQNSLMTGVREIER